MNPQNLTPETLLESVFRWEEMSPEEYAAKHWIEFGTFTLEKEKIKNLEFQKWLGEFEVIFNNPEKLEACRKRYLSDEEYSEQESKLRKIDAHGL